jgi:predicted dienelactone hydrolase
MAASREHGAAQVRTSSTGTDGAAGWADPSGAHYVAAVRSRLLALTIVASVAIAACGSDDDTSAPTTEAAAEATEATVETTEAPAETTPDTTEAAPETTEAALAELSSFEPGPYDVGVTTITVNADSERPLTVDVWFPVDDAGDAPLHQYTFLPEIYYESPSAVTADASQISPDGPYPLVVYSHGSGGLRYIAADYSEAIASYGYIVAAPDHTGNTAVELVIGGEPDRAANAFNRPNDVIAVIDAMTNPENTETVGFVASVDPELIAVTGHSAGGYTTYAVAAGAEPELGTIAPDPRIDAIVILAPTSSGITDEAFAAMTTPAMAIGGTKDTTTPIDPNITRPFDLAASMPNIRVDLIDAGHQSFSIACEAQAFLPTLPTEVPAPLIEVLDSYAEEGCGEGLMPIERAKELTNTFAINFLESVLRGGEQISDTNTTLPDDVIFMSR